MWPRSRQNKPKQFHSFFSKKTLLQETADRLKPLFKNEQIFIVASAAHGAAVKKQLPHIPKENILEEPESKNTGPAVLLAALHLHKKDTSATAAFLPSDHYVGQPAAFRQLLNLSLKIAKKRRATVTLGIQPNYPETGYGYIELGRKVEETGESKIFKVKKFKEKPDLKTAEKYVSSGKYLWNAGMFAWEIKHLISLFQKYAPEIYNVFPANLSPMTYDLTPIYAQLPAISVDYAILEKAPRILVVPANFGWSDIGHFGALKDILANKEENVVAGEHLGLDTTRSLILGKRRLIATIGLDDMIIVDEEDVLLVAPRARAQDVKKLVERLKEKGKHHYL